MNLQLKLRIPRIEEVLLFYYLTFMIWKNILFSRLPAGWILATGVLVILILTSYFKYRHEISKYWDVLALYLLITILFTVKFVGNPDMEPWIERDYGLISVVSWGGVFGYAVIRIQRGIPRIIKCLKITGVILLIYYSLQSLEVIKNDFWTYEQFGITKITTSNMSWSYGVLSAVCYISLFYFIDKKIIVFPIMALSLFGILLYGSRGTLIAFTIGVVFLILFYNDKRMPIKSYILLIIFAGLAFYALSDSGINAISRFFTEHGLSSRFIDSLTHFTAFEDTSNGRALIWLTVSNLIVNGPFYGYGVFGERNAVYGVGMRWGYSHNIFLEILVSFGWLFGSIIIVALLIQIIRFLKSSDHRNEKLVFVLFLTISMELLLSNTLWLHSGFWIMFGLLNNHFSHKKNGTIYKYQEDV